MAAISQILSSLYLAGKISLWQLAGMKSSQIFKPSYISKAPIRPFLYTPPEGALDIVHIDHELLVINKPAKLLSVPGKDPKHFDCLESRVQAEYPIALQVHRLDLDTSGLIIFAMNKVAQRHLNLQFEKRHVFKKYVTIVTGKPVCPAGEINLPLRCDWPNRPRQMVDWEQGKSAQTRFEVVETDGNTSRVNLYPRSGRSHQLRVHCAAIGHPICGDHFYGSDEVWQKSSRLQLHAQRLEFHHPQGGERVSFVSLAPF